MIQEEAAENIKGVTILMAHAQDHLMNAITVIDMAKEFIDLYEKMEKL
jgi:PTS system cellobiose-specific IIA component